MTFLQPAMLWFLGLLVPLGAIYFLKVRPTRQPTTTLFLWNEILQQKRSSALFRRLRDILSLLLMALAVSAVVLGMAGPSFTSPDHDKDIVLLIDNSASMSALEGRKTRLERAKSAARDIIRAMHMNRRAILASVANDVCTVVNLTPNKRQLIEGVNNVMETDMPLRKEALSGLQESKKLGEDYRVILISDGGFEGSDTLGEVELLKIGAPVENVGIVGFDLTPLPGNDNPLGLFFQLSSSFKETKTLDVMLSRDSLNNVVKVCPVTVRPGENDPEVFTITGGEPGRWFLWVDIEDSLTKDNIAYAAVREHRPIRVAVNAKQESFFFAKCVEAFSGRGGLMTLATRNPQLTVSCGQPVDVKTSALNVVFKPTGTSPLWKSLADENQVVLGRVLLPDHPGIRFCDLEAYTFTGCTQLTPPPGALILAETDAGIPLIYKTTQENAAGYVINMDPEESEFFLSAYFPVMIYSMAKDLTGKEPGRRASLRSGSYLPIPKTPTPQVIRVTDPSGQSLELRGETSRPLTRLGFYEVQTKDSTEAYACSLLNPRESLLDNAAVVDTSRPIPRGWGPSYILIVLAILISAIESILYHRRKVG